MKGLKTLLGLLILSIVSCSAKPLPPEAELAKTQEHSLWRAGAPAYAPDEYASYKTGLINAKDIIIKEEAKFGWFRDYGPAQAEYKKVLAEGQRILKLIGERKSEKSSSVEDMLRLYSERVKAIERLSSLINEGNLARRNLTRADILIGEARALYEKGMYAEAEARLGEAPGYLDEAEKAVSPILGRFTDKNHIATWRRWVEETVADSKATGGHAIVVSKADRSLVLYKAGKPLKTYGVGLGTKGSLDKLHAGDNATPEGRYRITKKLPRSKYYKALLINYPNDEDRKRFAEAKRKGIIPKQVGIGGLVEIHGGGKDSMTQGCVALENKHMEDLYNTVGVGTPVTIVGAMDHKNGIAEALGGL